MGFRLNIAKEPPTINNNDMYIFDDEHMILEGGFWELDIWKIVKDNTERINVTQQQCSTYPNCIMCDCSDDSWIKIIISDLINKEKYLLNNSNIAYSFLLDEISEEDFEMKKHCSYEYIVNKSHRDYIWINIS